MPKFNDDANVIALHRITVASPCSAVSQGDAKPETPPPMVMGAMPGPSVPAPDARAAQE